MIDTISELQRSILSFGAYTIFAIAGVFATLVIVSCIRALLKVR